MCKHTAVKPVKPSGCLAARTTVLCHLHTTAVRCDTHSSTLAQAHTYAAICTDMFSNRVLARTAPHSPPGFPGVGDGERGLGEAGTWEKGGGITFGPSSNT